MSTLPIITTGTRQRTKGEPYRGNCCGQVGFQTACLVLAGSELRLSLTSRLIGRGGCRACCHRRCQCFVHCRLSSHRAPSGVRLSARGRVLCDSCTCQLFNQSVDIGQRADQPLLRLTGLAHGALSLRLGCGELGPCE
jgi:hypothetical protein